MSYKIKNTVGLLKENAAIACAENEQNNWILRISVGYAVAESANMDIERLINIADEEMYFDKRSRSIK